ncbi:MAG: hypothetical protein FGM41_12520 [Bacteroidetes bacterium]|nr:hypothetical protein [Bacteroidota bacterium]
MNKLDNTERIESYKRDLQIYIEERDKYDALIKVILDGISYLENGQIEIGNTWKDKVKHLIRKKGRLMLSREIVEHFEKEVTKLNHEQLRNVIAGALSQLVRDKVLIPYKPATMKGSYYGFREWFSLNKPKKGYGIT